MIRTSIKFFLTAGLLALAWPGGAAQAATFVVTHFDDPAPTGCLRSCSLREAVMAANSQPGSHVIVLKAGTYQLTRVGPTNNPQASGPLSIRGAVTIVGAGMDKTRIRWNAKATHAHPVFRLENSHRPAIGLALEQLSVSHGRGQFGGCLESQATSSRRYHVLLTDTRFSLCQSSSGGAMRLHATDLTAIRSVFEKNHASNSGGALFGMGPINIQTTDTVWRENSAGANGGAAAFFGAGNIGWISQINWLDLGGGRIENNSAGDHGGGIAFSGSGELLLSSAAFVATGNRLAITGNSARRGGGLDLDLGILPGNQHLDRIRRVRISDNAAESGGGLASARALSLTDGQINGNTATQGSGGGILLHGNVNWQSGRTLERLSLFKNLASVGGGGGMLSTCALVHSSDLSLTENMAASGAGQGLQVAGLAALRHLSVAQNGAGGPGLALIPDPECDFTGIGLVNSIVTDPCADAGGFQFTSGGGNVLSDTALGCPNQVDDMTNVPRSALGLQFASWNGSFPVLGWQLSHPPRPQQGFGLSQHCSEADVRGWQRPPSSCDAGAFQAMD